MTTTKTIHEEIAAEYEKIEKMALALARRMDRHGSARHSRLLVLTRDLLRTRRDEPRS